MKRVAVHNISRYYHHLLNSHQMQKFVTPSVIFLPSLIGFLAVFTLLGGLTQSYADNTSSKQTRAKEAGSKQTNDPNYKQSKRLFRAVNKLLSQTAKQRHDAGKLPSESDFIVPPLWQDTKESRQEEIQEILNAALDIVTDVPLLKIEQRLHQYKRNISELEQQITSLREKRLTAPKDALLPGVLNDTVASIDENIIDLKKRISENKNHILLAKQDILISLKQSGIEITPDQLELMLGSVLGSDLVKMVAAFNAARHIDTRLGELMSESDGSIKSSRRYFAMHAALFAMLVHAQNHLVEKIDQVYLKRLKVILKDIRRARAQTRRLLRGRNRADQSRALQANLKSQSFAERVALFYRDYLTTQRAQLINARARTKRDLHIADNTYATVEASFQLRSLIEDAKASFKAMQLLEAPGFDQVFKNKQLRKEFENLTDKIAPPTS